MNLDFLTNTVVPTPIAAAGAVLLVVCLIVAPVIAGRRAARVALRRARLDPRPTDADRRTERRLMILAVVPTVMIWLAVFVISFIGLASWAQDDMGWNGWTRFIVPFSLDGIAISQGASAFSAAKRGRSTSRAEKAVLAGALVSATINFYHGTVAWSLMAGLYLGFLSIAGMWLFHELLRQFLEDLEEQRPRKRKVGIPQFGLRWVLALPSTFWAWRTWIVHPPDDLVESTVKNALEHRDRVRDARHQARATRGARRKHAVAIEVAELERTVPAPVPSVPRAAVQPVPPTSEVQGTAPIPVPPPPRHVPSPARHTAHDRPSPAANVDDEALKWVDHMLAVAATFPDWTDKMPPVRKAAAAIAASRGQGGAGSTSTTQKVFAAMEQLRKTEDPKATLEALRVVSETVSVTS